MKILVVTGRLAERTVRESVRDEADILVLDIEVASFITPALLGLNFPAIKYDLVLIPGLASGDFSCLDRKLDTKIRLGPKHAIDLGFVLSFARDVTFSSSIPACEILAEIQRKNAIDRMIEVENNSNAILSIKGLKLGGNSRIKVMAEIVDAGHLSEQELKNKIRYFLNKGADIIDLGISLDTEWTEVARSVMIARSVTDLPLSIDTLDPGHINAALNSGIDIVLSLNSENIHEVKKDIIRTQAAAVIIPDRVGDVESLFRNIESATSMGISNIIADPVLEPLGHGFVESVTRYYEFRKKDKTTPLFFGAGNVTELIDADSIGINAMLAGMAMELDASILFTPEYSDKAHGSVFELKTASIMMQLAKERGSAPKDLGIDLLTIKEKRRREFSGLPERYIEAEGTDKWHLDPAGCFMIGITDEKVLDGNVFSGMIVAENNNNSIVGATAREVLDTIIGLGLVSRLDHAAYLGRELMKAELGLKFKRSYSQDDEF